MREQLDSDGNLGVTLFHAGQSAAARKELEAALLLNPFNQEARRNLQVLELRAKSTPRMKR